MRYTIRIKLNGGIYMKQMVRYVMTIVLTFIIFGVSVVSAFGTTVQMGKYQRSPKYIGKLDFDYLYLTDGTPVYCLESLKDPATNQSMKQKSALDKGVLYILQNGYPNKSITGNNDYDHYITQVAIWWYLDRISGITDTTKTGALLAYNVKTTDSDPKGLRPYAKKLVEQAQAHRNDANPSYDIIINNPSTQLTMREDNKAFVSDYISVSSKANFSNYQVALTDGSKNAKIVDEKGISKTTFQAGEKFRVVIPASDVTELKMTFHVSVTATTSIPVAYRYTASSNANGDVQDITPGVDYKSKTVKASFPLNLITTRVEIEKKDINSKDNLAGAKLVLKDINGTVIEEWTSTADPYKISFLKAGKYILEEIEAPNGYSLNKQKVEFEVVVDGLVKTVVMYNEPIVKVPDTGINRSMVFYGGLGLLVLGLGTFYYDRKKKY